MKRKVFIAKSENGTAYIAAAQGRPDNYPQIEREASKEIEAERRCT